MKKQASKRIVYLGAKPLGVHCLRNLIDRQAELGIEIIAVGTDFNAESKRQNNLIELSKANDLPLLASLEALPECDFIISIQYHKILKQKHIDKAGTLAINLHMAAVPEYRGCNAFSFAILDKVKEFGTTLHVMDHSIDGGDIIFESRFPMPEKCTVKQLHALTEEKSKALFTDHIDQILNMDFQPIPQSSFAGIRVSGHHYRSEIAKIKVIDLDWPAEKINRHIRATYFPPFEPPYALVEGKKVYFVMENDWNA